MVMTKLCNFCQSNFSAPQHGQSDSHWVWENKKDRLSGGMHYCRINRSLKKRAAWDNFYKKKQLRCVVSRAVTQKLKYRGKSKSGSIINNMPFSIDELKIHLESKFQPGMTWDNYGKWHVDHITPDVHFSYDKMTDSGFLKSWDLNNLQPLWATDNHKKYNKLVN